MGAQISQKKKKKECTRRVDSTLDSVKTIVFGEKGVGKTSLLIQLTKGEFDGEYQPTQTLKNYETNIVFQGDNKSHPILILDQYVGGVTGCALRQADVFPVIYSITSKSSFLSVQNHFSLIHEVRGVPPPVVLVGNKRDLEEKREVSTEEGEKLAAELSIPFIEVSASSKNDVDQLFQLLAHHAIYGEEVPWRANVKKAKKTEK